MVCQSNFLWSNKLLFPFLFFKLCTDDTALVGVESVECTEEVMVCVEGVVLLVDGMAVRAVRVIACGVQVGLCEV